PRLGSYVISRAAIPPEALAKPEIASAEKSHQPLDEVAASAAVEDESLQDMATTNAQGTPTTPHTLPQSTRHLSLADLPDNIHVISAGYDVNTLEPIVQALHQWLTPQSQITA
ncbi:MAG: hypothetical protein FWF98_01270, partial [Dehalococcoidia bacterium]|nr:hypothetical protein [Dehalococcoidia bacterium]